MLISCKLRCTWFAELELSDGSDVVSNVVEALSLLDTYTIIDGVGLRISGWRPRLEDGPDVLDDMRLVAVVAV